MSLLPSVAPSPAGLPLEMAMPWSKIPRRIKKAFVYFLKRFGGNSLFYRCCPAAGNGWRCPIAVTLTWLLKRVSSSNGLSVLTSDLGR